MRGKLTIIAILIVALTTACFAWWWRATSQQRIREFWGPSALQAINFARQVEAFKLAKVDGTQMTLSERVQQVPPDEFVDISQAPGLIHAKHSLVEEASFDWESPPDSIRDRNWSYGVRFHNGAEVVTVLFDFERRALAHVEANKSLTMIEKTSNDWKGYLDRRAFANSR